MHAWRVLAARNNAELCDAVARTHGLEPRFDEDAWTSDRRTPRLYPDAVALTDGVPAASLLARVDPHRGCSIKDSFASLDLADHGFEILFDARWIVRPAAGPAAPQPELPWDAVTDANDFAAWEALWRGDGPADVLRPTLLRARAVVIAAARQDGHIVAGAMFNRSDEVVGISNFFASGCSAAAAWAGAVAYATLRFPDVPLVGYESGPDLEGARGVGFEDAGPLRIWTN